MPGPKRGWGAIHAQQLLCVARPRLPVPDGAAARLYCLLHRTAPTVAENFNKFKD